MNIQIITYSEGWIASALADQLKKDLEKKGKEVIISKRKPGAIAHTYIHLFYYEAIIVEEAINILYVTHIDHWWKAIKLIQYSGMGCSFICMSSETKKLIEQYTKKSKVSLITPRSIHFLNETKEDNSKITFGIFYRNYQDGRKNPKLLIKLIKYIAAHNDTSRLIVYGEGFEFIKKNVSGN